MIPPGLAYCAVSERAWKRMEATKNPRYYFDLAQGAQVGGKRRVSLYASDFLVCGVRGGAGLRPADG